MLKELFNHRRLIFSLAKNDFKAKYATSFLGTVWALVLPLTNILVFWYVFQVGLRNGNVGDYPFIVWYAPAFLVWTYFADSFSGATNSIREYSYLIKKVNFPVLSIPIIKIISVLIIHVVFLIVIVIINLFYGIYPNIYYLQSLYYLLAITINLMGLGWLFSALAVVFPDTVNLVSVALQLGFWVSPIIWNPSSMSDQAQRLLRINPMYYICEGYRNSFLYQSWFWEDMGYTIYFWIATIIIWILGTYVFRNTKDRFADLV